MYMRVFVQGIIKYNTLTNDVYFYFDVYIYIKYKIKLFTVIWFK